MSELVSIPCQSTFEVYEPEELFRFQCPKILVVCRRAHTHPIPIPTKTPKQIREDLHELFLKMGDLANLTTRRFLRSDAARMFLEGKLPGATNPTFIDLHPSLNNRDHIQSMINQAQSKVYPKGTGWEGVQRMFNETIGLPSSERYIRAVEEDPSVNADDPSEPFRYVVCMRHANMLSLAKTARHVQSDISFKRVIGWLEFELGAFDRTGNMCVCYVRVFLNRQSAEAHRVVLLKIHRLVQEETGKEIQFRHLHASYKRDLDFEGILSWTVDQHGGQAKGIGEYLQAIAPPQKMDLYETRRLLTDLGPYDHLKRFLCICVAHFYRNIQETHNEAEVQRAMRSLACVNHRNWDDTVEFILEKGNQKAKNWLADKDRSKFAFPALCWEKSFIPLEIWQATDGTSNVIESMHFDVLREGGHSTLLAGILRGEEFDRIQDQTFETSRATGVPRRHRMQTSSARQLKVVSRQTASQTKRLREEDEKIVKQNEDLLKARDAVLQARHKQRAATTAEANRRAKTGSEALVAKYTKVLAASDKMGERNMGSGQFEIELYDLCLSDEDDAVASSSRVADGSKTD
ncbi:hypothetical protein AAF712_013365 [Marasmius tenuissimus]|uniref:Transposase n=1 Tax=Marasmius tenuissimus TaxID=585030 RepID=A0ABR2ZGJ5_9AGAR